jgi:hypothetical protein
MHSMRSWFGKEQPVEGEEGMSNLSILVPFPVSCAQQAPDP